jgi:hypothetical protein
MGIQEKEIVELFREIKAERHGANITSEGLATLTMARYIKQVLEKCCVEICGAIEQSQPMTMSQARAILEMDRLACGEGQGPETVAVADGWGDTVEQAEILTGEKAVWRQ